MTDLLLRLFVKDPSDRTAVGSLSGAVGIGCNLLLFAVKLLAGILTGSLAAAADAMNNLFDASGSIMTLLGFRMAEKPADERHPYGHARAEYLSALGVSVLVLVVSLELAWNSVKKILNPTPVTFSVLALGLLAGSILVKFWLSRFYKGLGRMIDSTALAAASADSRNDCLSTTAVLLAALGERWLQIPLDGFFGLGVAVFILKGGWDMTMQTVSSLLGESPDSELRQKIVDYVEQQPKVLGYHDLMVHDYGPGKRFASLHVEMDCREDPLECHERIDDMERECLRSHNVQLVIHYDPVVTDDPELNALRDRCARLLREQDSRLALHDFRVVEGKRHRNLVFDVALPSDLQGREEAITAAVEAGMNDEGKRAYHVKITFDSAQFNL